MEHVIPEGLGNRGLGGHSEIVLPKGVVCDKCNNGKLSELDQTLIKFSPIAFMSTVHGVTTKTGALPKAKFGNASMEMPAPGSIFFDSNSPKAFRRTPDGFRVTVRSNQKMIPNYCRKLTRSLFKMTLGCIYIDHGHELALSERFDPVREMVLGLKRERKFHGYLAMAKKVQNPSSRQCRLMYAFCETEEGQETVVVTFDYFGVIMASDLEVRDPKCAESLLGDVAIVHAF